jgi:hypothetical protein
VGPDPVPAGAGLIAVVDFTDVPAALGRLERLRGRNQDPFLDACALGTASASYYPADVLDGVLTMDQRNRLDADGAVEVPIDLVVPCAEVRAACGRVTLTRDAVVWQAGFWERGEFVEAQLPTDLLEAALAVKASATSLRPLRPPR